MIGLWQDVKRALGAMRKHPGFAAVAVLTIALGIGANTAIFSVVHAVLLRPFPYPAEEPEHVLLVRETLKQYPDPITVAYPNYKDWRDQNESFSTMAAIRDTRENLTGTGEAVPMPIRQVTYSYFTIMGIPPLHGRLFTAEEDRPGGTRVALLNYSAWVNRFGGDLGAVGHTIRLNRQPYTVIGVLPPDTDLLIGERIYTPYEVWASTGNSTRANHMGTEVIARLRPGVTFEQASAEMSAIASRLAEEYPDTNSGGGVHIDRYNEFRTQDYRQTLYLLLGAVGLVLLIACANVANLLLARAVTRQRATAIQAALGAGRLRIVRQSLAESLVLAAVGGLVGLGLGFLSLKFLGGILPEDLPRRHEIDLNWLVLGYTFVVACLTGLIFGIIPALETSRVNLGEILKQTGATAGTFSARRRFGRGFLVAEVAVATVLLIGAGLLIRTIRELMQVDPGFRTGRLLKMEMVLDGESDTNRNLRFFREVRQRLAALPGVESVGVSLSAPMMGVIWSSVFTAADQPVPPRDQLPSSILNTIDVGYIETFGIPILRGRSFTEADGADAPPVVIVNQTLARRIWGDEDPIGRQVKFGWPESEGENFPWREVVGLAADTKQIGLGTDTDMETYIPFAQRPLSYAKVTLRTAVDPRSLVEPSKKAIHEIDPTVPVAEIATMDEILAASMAPRRATMILLTAFGALALLLAAVGTYGVIAYSVARRTQELGVRMAIGAQRTDVLRLVLSQGIKLALLGAAIGIFAATGLTRLLESLLFGVSPLDPLTFALAPVALAVVALAACAIPAIRAMRIPPSSALRCE